VANNSKIKMVAAMYQSGPAITQAIKDKVKRDDFELLESNDMKEVVSRAYKLLQEKGQGGYVLFSPTAPSFGVYKNFMERGQHFMTTVKNLLEKEV
ncbi:MAG: hypothetical protein IJX20_04450, partial [Alphaproteobacteria bacterium]|nr:hypothetical protein [Alphaproteobacteria bacterium]